MKKINFLLIAIIFVGTTLVSSCKKEDKIEKNLWKKGGEWNIESFVSKLISTYQPDLFDETVYNIGTYTFNENGSGSYLITYDGFSETETFTYSNTEDKLTFIIDNEAKVFDIIESEKNEIKISYTGNFYEGIENSVGTRTYTETVMLKKK